MKTLKLKLTLNLDIDPNGSTEVGIRYNIVQFVRKGLDRGEITGDLPATVEGHSFEITKEEEHRCKC